MKIILHWKVIISLLFTTSLLISSPIAAKPNHTKWQAWIAEFRTEALLYGIDPTFFDKTFNKMQPSKKHLRLYNNQPETRSTYYEYRKIRVNDNRIKNGRKYYKKYYQLLNEIGHRYNVSPCFIMSLWGLESAYGHYTGKFDVIRSLATLAYGSQRRDFFRNELLLALTMVNDGDIARKDFKGEWAGASGQSQFLPSSWYKYAVDYNGDGKKDIWHTKADVFASIANYLHQYGWIYHQPVLANVSLPPQFDQNLLGYKTEQTIAEWQAMRVKIAPGQQLPPVNTLASIVHPYGGPIFMVFNNFKVLLDWNRSTYYAGTVTYTAHKICGLDNNTES